MANNVKWIKEATEVSLLRKIYYSMLKYVASVLFCVVVIRILNNSIFKNNIPPYVYIWTFAWFFGVIFIFDILIPGFILGIKSKSKRTTIYTLSALVVVAMLFLIHISNLKDIVLGCKALYGNFLKLYNTYYKTNIVFKDLSSKTTCISSVIFVIQLFYLLVFLLSKAIKTSGLLCLNGLTLICICMWVGISPSWGEIVIFICGILLLLSIPSERGIYGCQNVTGKIWEELLQLALRGALVTVIVIVLSIVFKQNPIDIKSKYKKAISFQAEFEANIKDFYNFKFKQRTEAVGNIPPRYNNKNVLTITANKKQTSNMYLKDYVGSSYEDGIWEDDNDYFKKKCKEAGVSTDEVADYLVNQFYNNSLSEDSTNIYKNEIKYNIKYENMSPISAVPYGTLLGEGMDYYGDSLFEKSTFKKEVDITSVSILNGLFYDNAIHNSNVNTRYHCIFGSLTDEEYKLLGNKKTSDLFQTFYDFEDDTNGNDNSKSNKKIHDWYSDYVKKYSTNNQNFENVQKCAQKIVRQYYTERHENEYDYLDSSGEDAPMDIFLEKIDDIYEYCYNEYGDYGYNSIEYDQEIEKEVERVKKIYEYRMSKSKELAGKYYNFRGEYNNYQTDISYETCFEKNELIFNSFKYSMLNKKGLNVELEKYKMANYVADYLQKRFSYSLSLDELPPDTDAVEYFLKTGKEGFCVHFATAGVLILREMGIPARYASGYIVKRKSFNQMLNGKYVSIVPDNNAHAWVEIYLDGVGWVPIEMTPGYNTVQDYVPTADAADSDSGKPSKHNNKNNDSEAESESETESETKVKKEKETETQQTETQQTETQQTETQKTNDGIGGNAITEKQNILTNIKDFFNMPIVKAIIVVFLILALLAIYIRRKILNYINEYTEAVRKKHYNKAIRRVNTYVKWNLMLKNKRINRKMSDNVYIKLLIENYPQVTPEQWNQYMDIIRKVRFSDMNSTEEEHNLVYEIYTTIKNKVKD